MSKELSGDLATTPIVEVMRSILLERRNGSLLIQNGQARRRFVFFDGELYLPGGHALARHLGQLMDSEGAMVLGVPRSLTQSGQVRVNTDEEASAAARDRLQHIVNRIVDVLQEWDEGSFVFHESPLNRADFIGPLPTGYLVMEASVRDLEPEDIRARFGGDDALVIADTASELLPQLQGLDPGEMFMVSRAEHPVALGELLRQVPGDREEVLLMAGRLRAVDLLLPYDREVSSDSASGSDQDRLLASLVDRFLERIGERLTRHPLTLDEAEHRQHVGDLLSRLAALNHYELLAVDLHSDEATIHGAFEDRAALVHPDNAERLNLSGREAALRLAFERITAAYLTLNDPVRRAEYNQRAGIDAMHTPKQGLGEEQRQAARRNFIKAKELLAQGDYHFALELARQALRVEPRAEYFAILGETQSRNPRWSEQAIESYRQAIKRDPDNAEYRVSLGKILEQFGQTNHAKLQYRAALQKSPGEGEAMEGLERLAKQPAPKKVKKPAADPEDAREQTGVLGKLKGLLGN